MSENDYWALTMGAIIAGLGFGEWQNSIGAGVFMALCFGCFFGSRE